MRTETGLSQTLDLTNIRWLPVGPKADRQSQLMGAISLGHVQLVVHAVEVLFDEEQQLVSKAPELEYMLYAVEVIAGNAAQLQRHRIDGRNYVVVAVPAAIEVRH